MSEWTVKPTTRRTPYGLVHYGGPCRDDYPNMETIDQLPEKEGNLIVILQRPAARALLAAQVRFARRSGWSKQRIERHTIRLGRQRYPIGRPIIILPGSNRTCATQTILWKRDPDRYARPEITGHTRGIAIDRSNLQAELGLVDTCLAAEGWRRTRPDDEPWHWSYGFTV